MNGRKIPNREALIEALREFDGNMAAAGRKFGCHRGYISQLVNDDQELRELVNELKETFIDEAENKLYEAIRDGNIVAILFFLKTQARHRGYSERFEFVPITQQQIEVELGNVPTISDKVKTLNTDRPAVALLEQ
jgi:hypothetical protein